MYFQSTNPPMRRGRRSAISALIVTIALCTSLPETAFAQRGYDDEEPRSEDNSEREWSSFAPVRVTQKLTDGVAAQLRQSARFCDLIPEKAYLFDCYATELKRIARSLPATGDYAKARAALEDAGREMEALVNANLDSSKPSLRVRSGGSKTKTSARRLRAVKPSSVRQVAREAEAIIERTQTVLLRATGNSDRRRAHYQQIAQSMETGTVMLRSL